MLTLSLVYWCSHNGGRLLNFLGDSYRGVLVLRNLAGSYYILLGNLLRNSDRRVLVLGYLIVWLNNTFGSYGRVLILRNLTGSYCVVGLLLEVLGGMSCRLFDLICYLGGYCACFRGLVRRSILLLNDCFLFSTENTDTDLFKIF